MDQNLKKNQTKPSDFNISRFNNAFFLSPIEFSNKDPNKENNLQQSQDSQNIPLIQENESNTINSNQTLKSIENNLHQCLGKDLLKHLDGNSPLRPLKPKNLNTFFNRKINSSNNLNEISIHDKFFYIYHNYSSVFPFESYDDFFIGMHSKDNPFTGGLEKEENEIIKNQILYNKRESLFNNKPQGRSLSFSYSGYVKTLDNFEEKVKIQNLSDYSIEDMGEEKMRKNKKQILGSLQNLNKFNKEKNFENFFSDKKENKENKLIPYKSNKIKKSYSSNFLDFRIKLKDENFYNKKNNNFLNEFDLFSNPEKNNDLLIGFDHDDKDCEYLGYAQLENISAEKIQLNKNMKNNKTQNSSHTKYFSNNNSKKSYEDTSTGYSNILNNNPGFSPNSEYSYDLNFNSKNKQSNIYPNYSEFNDSSINLNIHNENKYNFPSSSNTDKEGNNTGLNSHKIKQININSKENLNENFFTKKNSSPRNFDNEIIYENFRDCVDCDTDNNNSGKDYKNIFSDDYLQKNSEENNSQTGKNQNNESFDNRNHETFECYNMDTFINNPDYNIPYGNNNEKKFGEKNLKTNFQENKNSTVNNIKLSSKINDIIEKNTHGTKFPKNNLNNIFGNIKNNFNNTNNINKNFHSHRNLEILEKFEPLNNKAKDVFETYQQNTNRKPVLINDDLCFIPKSIRENINQANFSGYENNTKENPHNLCERSNIIDNFKKFTNLTGNPTINNLRKSISPKNESQNNTNIFQGKVNKNEENPDEKYQGEIYNQNQMKNNLFFDKEINNINNCMQNNFNLNEYHNNSFENLQMDYYEHNKNNFCYNNIDYYQNSNFNNFENNNVNNLNNFNANTNHPGNNENGQNNFPNSVESHKSMNMNSQPKTGWVCSQCKNFNYESKEIF